MTNEVLYGIRLIKFFAWEDSFMQRILNIRREEVRSPMLCTQNHTFFFLSLSTEFQTSFSQVKHLATRKYLDAWCVFFWATTPVFISILTFGAYRRTRQNLSLFSNCIRLTNMGTCSF